jgi:hypothetical protein
MVGGMQEVDHGRSARPVWHGSANTDHKAPLKSTRLHIGKAALKSDQIPMEADFRSMA